MWKQSPHSLGSIQLIDLLTFSCAVYRQESLTYTLQCYSSLSLRPLNPAIFTNLLTKASRDNIFWELSFYGSRSLWNDLYCVEWDVKTLLYHTIPYHSMGAGVVHQLGRWAWFQSHWHTLSQWCHWVGKDTSSHATEKAIHAGTMVWYTRV